MGLLRYLPTSVKEAFRRRAGAVTTRSRLQNLRRVGFVPQYIIDAGAFRGEWAELALEIFPEASVLMIEPNPLCEQRLREQCQREPKLRFHKALLGDRPGTVKFAQSESNSQVVQESLNGKSTIELPVETLADIARQEGFTSCNLLKLDLQGYELKALEGAGNMFGSIEVIVTEVSWLKLGEVPLVDEVINRFYEHGYRLYDVFGLNHRPLDDALWQTDLIFVRKDSSLVQDRRWASNEA